MKLIAWRVSVVAIALGLSSCSQAFGESAECGVSEVWNKNFETFADSDTNIIVTVNEESYGALGWSFNDAEGLERLVKKLDALHDVPAQILVRSDRSIPCEKFLQATQIIERNYSCEKAKVCFAAYGLGRKFLPPSVPPPPPDASSR